MLCLTCGRQILDPMSENSTGAKAHLCGAHLGPDPKCRPLTLRGASMSIGTLRADLHRLMTALPVARALQADDALPGAQQVGPALRRARGNLEAAAGAMDAWKAPWLPADQHPGSLVAEAFHNLHRAATRNHPILAAIRALGAIGTLADRARRLATRLLQEEVKATY